jgi:hypothetical protein
MREVKMMIEGERERRCCVESTTFKEKEKNTPAKNS